jgi:transcriptional regulator with XRE-family HTH domain
MVPPSLGAIIRRQRELAALPMRQLAEAVGISNPYLSQIERDLRAPSDAVLAAIARTLQTTANELYAQAGYRTSDDDPAGAGSLLAAIAEARELTGAQRKAMTEVYRGFLAANAARRRGAG